MSKTFLKIWLLLLLMGFSSLALANEDSTLLGHWEGWITYKEANLAIRLSFDKQGGNLAGKLDIPSLVYADQVISVREGANEIYFLEFPFGIGAVEFHHAENGEWHGVGDGTSVILKPGNSKPYREENFSFGAFDPPLGGTLFIPEGQGPFPAVILIAGSGSANRAQWSYASWADFYARQGIAAFIYDRRPEMFLKEDGEMLTMDDHALDLTDAVIHLKDLPEINPEKVGAAGHSRGGWIAMALGNQVADLAFMIFLSPAAVTPAEQNIDSNLTGMDQDGLARAELEAARNYFRLYFYVAKTGQGWDLLEPAIKKAQETTWGQYVDQPRNLDDLRWWNANMDFAAAQNLRGLKMPVLALWGKADFITPYSKYEEVFRQNLEIGGNKRISTLVFSGADHRIEVNPGAESDGKWHWFGLAPGALKAISEWVWEIIE